MQAPAAATSLGRFWGGRWNAAFSNLMQAHFFIPWARRIGARWAVLAVFFLSGLLHELVISVPARGGYGGPTAYFLIQAIGLTIERSRTGRQVGLGRGLRGWCFVALVTIGPVFWLFHTAFIRNVILPMLQVIGAT
jgi:hypothetical protein